MADHFVLVGDDDDVMEGLSVQCLHMSLNVTNVKVHDALRFNLAPCQMALSGLC